MSNFGGCTHISADFYVQPLCVPRLCLGQCRGWNFPLRLGTANFFFCGCFFFRGPNTGIPVALHRKDGRFNSWDGKKSMTKKHSKSNEREKLHTYLSSNLPGDIQGHLLFQGIWTPKKDQKSILRKHLQTAGIWMSRDIN